MRRELYPYVEEPKAQRSLTNIRKLALRIVEFGERISSAKSLERAFWINKKLIHHLFIGFVSSNSWFYPHNTTVLAANTFLPKYQPSLASQRSLFLF